MELVIDQIIIVPYCYIFFTISSLSFFGTELYLRIVVKAVKVSVYSFNLHGFTNRHRDDVRQGKSKMTEMEVDGGGGWV